MKIIWSKEAEEDFEQNILYLMEKWNESVILNFTSETERILKIITTNPNAFQKHKKSNVHFVPITKHISLFYDVKSQEIELLRFWNNYKKPNKKKLK